MFYHNVICTFCEAEEEYYSANEKPALCGKCGKDNCRENNKDIINIIPFGRDNISNKI